MPNNMLAERGARLRLARTRGKWQREGQRGMVGLTVLSEKCREEVVSKFRLHLAPVLREGRKSIKFHSDSAGMWGVSVGVGGYGS